MTVRIFIDGKMLTPYEYRQMRENEEVLKRAAEEESNSIEKRKVSFEGRLSLMGLLTSPDIEALNKLVVDMSLDGFLLENLSGHVVDRFDSVIEDGKYQGQVKYHIVGFGPKKNLLRRATYTTIINKFKVEPVPFVVSSEEAEKSATAGMSSNVNNY